MLFLPAGNHPGTLCEAEIHWFESHDMGREDFKIKRTIR